MYIKRVLLSFALTSSMLMANSSNAIIRVANNSDFDRNDEIVEIPDADKIVGEERDYALYDSDGSKIIYQMTHDNMLIFPASLKAHSECIFQLEKGENLRTDTLLAYTIRPDCQDDFAWENEHSGYRLYGPSFVDKWGNVHGYDIWCKRDIYPIVNTFYDLDHGPEHISYHKDHGNGFDGYTVGPTLGAGGNALMYCDSIIYHTGYRKCQVLDYGPLRLSFKFVGDSLNIDGEKIAFSRTLTLDKNSHFNKISLQYEGLDTCAIDSCMKVAVGIVVHADNPEGYSIAADEKSAYVVDLSDDINAGNGEIYIAVIMPDADESNFMKFDNIVANAIGQCVLTAPLYSSSPIQYYMGAGWNKSTVSSEEKWTSIVDDFKSKLGEPLEVSVSF